MKNYKYYPEDQDYLYYLEFCSDDDLYSPKTWTLFKRNFIEPSLQVYVNDISTSKEFHPYNLGSGTVHPDNYHTMFTEKYLKFIVDAMNLAVDKIENIE